jgi:prefoldin alpha subunit
MAKKEELEERVVAFRILQARLDTLLTQRNALVARFIEIETTLQSIEDVMRSRESLFQIGSGAWTKGKRMGKKLIVEVGAGVALEKTPEEARVTLQRRKAEVQRALRIVQQGIANTSAELERLGPEIRRLAEELR